MLLIILLFFWITGRLGDTLSLDEGSQGGGNSWSEVQKKKYPRPDRYAGKRLSSNDWLNYPGMFMGD
jgi:hypothetical protein